MQQPQTRDTDDDLPFWLQKIRWACPDAEEGVGRDEPPLTRSTIRLTSPRVQEWLGHANIAPRAA
jgi:hypothetical protein